MSRSVRPASIDDLPALLAIDTGCFARPWTADGWRSEFDAARQQPVVLLIGEPPLGFASAPIVGDRCELRRIAVMPSARGRGLARDLLAAVIAHARAAPCAQVELEVAANNDAALSLYRSAGFREVGRRPHYYRDPPADAVLLTLALAAPNADPPG